MGSLLLTLALGGLLRCELACDHVLETADHLGALGSLIDFASHAEVVVVVVSL